MREELGQVEFGVHPDKVPGDPKKWSKNRFLSPAKDVPRRLTFGYVVDHELLLASYFGHVRIGPHSPSKPAIFFSLHCLEVRKKNFLKPCLASNAIKFVFPIFQTNVFTRCSHHKNNQEIIDIYF